MVGSVSKMTEECSRHQFFSPFTRRLYDLSNEKDGGSFVRSFLLL